MTKIKNLWALLFSALMMAMTAAPAMAQSASTPEEAIASGSTRILALLALFGGAVIGVALARVGWDVGVKFIKGLKRAA